MECLFCFAVMVGFAFFGKYILAGISILTGNKDSLHDFGNLCDEPIPFKDSYYTPEEQGKPPRDPNAPTFKWRDISEGPDGSPWGFKRPGDREGDNA